MRSFLIAILIGLAIGFIIYNNNKLELQENYNILGKIGHYTLYKYETDYCATALDVIYEDEQNVYYFTCIKSENYFLKNVRETINIKDALQTKLIHINDLIKLEPNIIIHPKENWYNSHIPAGEYLIIYSKI
ncbi:MAG: hypothetical protein K0Q49_597 [Haloplasmataceae bacterium]|jgi:hypothetical protein|nr:hypothetical protein [Haloplasmataceae bacterium]